MPRLLPSTTEIAPKARFIGSVFAAGRSGVSLNILSRRWSSVKHDDSVRFAEQYLKLAYSVRFGETNITCVYSYTSSLFATVRRPETVVLLKYIHECMLELIY